jgi:hypothetical protein
LQKMKIKNWKKSVLDEIHGGQLLCGPKLVQSCSVYEEEEE